MSQYLKDKVQQAHNLPEDLQQLLHNDASMLSALGAESDQDYRDFFYISLHARAIANALAQKLLDAEEISKVSSCMYQCRNEFPIDTVFGVYKAVSNAMDLVGMPIKMAYPQGFGNMYMQAPHNIQAWLQTMREMYATANQQNIDLGSAFQIVTKKWKTMDKLDFQHWLSFYQGNNHLKYKTAAPEDPKYYEVGEGAMLPLQHLRSQIPGVPQRIPDDEASEARRHASEQERRRQLEVTLRQAQDDIRKKLIARLAAAEKIFMNNLSAFQKMLGTEHERWLSILHDLKRKIQVATPVNARSSLLEDLIYKEANKLDAQGFVKSADMVRKFAQPAPPPVGADPTAPPGGDMGMPADLGLDMPGGDMTGAAPAAEPVQPGDEDKAMEEFVRNLTGETDPDEDEEDLGDVNDLRVEAQTMPEPGVSSAPVPEPVPEPVPDAPKPEPDNRTMAERAEVGDAEIDKALRGVTIKDVVSKLEGLAQQYRVRDQTRQLTVVDLMMQSLGVSSYFPNLSEAINKAFDSNQYILTRIDDILSRLRGAADGGVGTASLKERLESQKSREEARKAHREAEPPETEAPGAEMASPVEVQTGAPPAEVR